MTSSRDDTLIAAPLEPRGFSVAVETKVARFQFACGGDETLLTAGLAAGYDLPYECSTGTCGTCHARVISGEVDPGWREAPGYAKLNLDKGDVLMCQAHPGSNCAIRVRSSAAQPASPTRRALRRRGRVDVVRPLTKDVVHFEVALSEPMSFDAGQFVGLRHIGVTGVRAYSMVNHGEILDRLSFVIKRKPGGRFSDAVFEGGVHDLDLEVIGPLGRATFRPTEDRDFVCIAGGSGIAGMMSMLAQARGIDYFRHHRANIFFGVRTVADAFYLAEFAEHLVAAGGGLNVVVAISDEGEVRSHHPEFPDVRLAKGLVHEVAQAEMRGKWSNEIAFVAGPQPMVDAAIRMLITDAKMKPGDIRFDKFS